MLLPAFTAGHVWRAPRWRAGTAPAAPLRAGSLGDRLAAGGLADGARLAAHLSAWHLVFAATLPDVVVGDYAPGALLAARDRIPSLAIGTGYSVPPRDVAEFPLSADSAGRHFDEDAVLAVVNAVLARSGASALARLPQVLNGDRDCVCTIPPIDHYPERQGKVAGLASATEIVPATEDRDGVVCYFQPGRDRRRLAKVASAVKSSGLPATILLPGATSEELALFEAPHIITHGRFVPLPPLLARARLLLHAGSHGAAGAALLAGIPQLLLPYDREKIVTGRNITNAGTGIALGFGNASAEAIAEACARLADDTDMQEAASRLAVQLAPWRVRDPVDEIAAAAEALAG